MFHFESPSQCWFLLSFPWIYHFLQRLWSRTSISGKINNKRLTYLTMLLFMNIYYYRLSPATWAMPRARPTAEYVKDMIAATMDSHQTWSKSGICENITSMTPKAIIYPLADMWHGSFPPLLWKQFDLFIALNFGQNWLTKQFDPLAASFNQSPEQLWELTSC